MSIKETDFLEDFFTFLKFKSIGSEAAYKKDTLDCCDWLANYLMQIGLKVSLWEKDGHPPCILAEYIKDENAKTVLFYGHYDVQPVDPLELWDSPPFEPEVRDGEIYARGACDDKGQIFYTITAIAELLKKDGTLPLNVKLLIEGEEEFGSKSLTALLPQKKEEVAADYLVVVDTGYEDENRPAVTIGVRGICALTVKITGSNTDLHSGVHGGVAFNPNHALVEVLAKLRDENGKILVPGFYDDVVPAVSETLSELDTHFDEKGYESFFGAKATGGEKGYSAIESNWLRPCLEINGIGGGYSGDGFKTVIPKEAIAKISCRLVPDQDGKKIAESIASFIKENTPGGLRVEVDIPEHNGGAFRSKATTTVVQAAQKAFTKVLGTDCKLILCGASIPITSDLTKASGAETVLVGHALPGDKIHAPNEHFGVERFKKGHATIVELIKNLGE